MKRAYIFIFIAILVIIGLLWWHGHKRIADEKQISASNSSSEHPPVLGKTNSATIPGQATQLAANQKSTIVDAAVKEYVEKSMADPQYDWKQPINFYGRVVDENNTPVADAGVHFEWNDISEKGTSDADATSDANGLFSLKDRRGKRLYVDVGKAGYYSSGDARNATFEYANPADGLFHPDANSPVVFHLRKKGVGVDLITSQYGITPNFPVSIPRDGTPIKIDFMERKAGDSGQMQITENKPEFKNWKQATNWWFRMEIPDGGFVEENDEFPFAAPDTGYTNVVEFNFQKDQSDWVLNLKKDYYIKFGSPPKYGLLHLQTGISHGGAIFTYAINPDGSQNLEPK